MRVLVIGGTGFVGIHIVDALISEGVDVVVTRRPRSATFLLRRRNCSLVNAALDDVSSLRQAMQGCDAVVVSGAPYPRYSLDAETQIGHAVQCVENACEAAAQTGISRFVFTSTIATLGTTDSKLAANEGTRLAAAPLDSVYRQMKWELERVVETHRERGLNAVTLLPGACLGPLDLRLGTTGLFVAVVRGALPWYVDGWVNAVDVRDVATAHARAVLHPSPGDRYCLGGTNIGFHALIAEVQARYGGVVPRLRLEAPEAKARATNDELLARPRNARVVFPRELVDVVAAGQPVDSQKALDELGVSFRPLATTLDDTYDWLRRSGVVPQHRIEQEGVFHASDC